MQTKAGSIKAIRTIKERHGEDYFSKIGSKGGKTPTTKPKGFAALTPEQRTAVSKKGGAAGKRHAL